MPQVLNKKFVMPRVLNKKTATAEELAGAVYVGRPSKWGNPFTHVRSRSQQARWRVDTRDAAVDRFIVWVMQPHQAGLRTTARRELRGRDLVCWCVPERCHAGVWLIIAASESDEALTWVSLGLVSETPPFWLEG